MAESLQRTEALQSSPSRLIRWRDASSHWVARVSDTSLDAMVFALAAWTVIYHLCLVARVTALWAALAEVAILPLCLWLGWRANAPATQPALDSEGVARPRHAAGGQHQFRILAGVAAGAAIAAAVLFALRTGPWLLTWALWLLAAVLGTIRALRLHHERPAQPERSARHDAEETTRGAAAAWLWAAGLAAFSLFLNRSNRDDAYYVNLTTWVAERGTFPLRDTVFSDLAFPPIFWPPVASYEALVGTASRFVPLSSPDVVYLVVPPVATFLATLALWRLLRVWRTRALTAALTIAVLFLLWGGANSQSFGNFFVGRIWQGKTLLLCLMVPLLLVYLQRFAQRPLWARVPALAAAGIAGTGLSTNGMFLVPLLALAGIVPLLPRAPWRAVIGAVAMAFYPLGAGVVTLALGGYTPENYSALAEHTVPPWLTHHVLGHGVRAGVALSAALLGCLVVRQSAGRVLTGATALVAAVVFAPAVPLFIFHTIGLGQTLWRVMWMMPVAALVGALGTSVFSITRNRFVRLAAPLALAATVVIAGTPIWARTNGKVEITASPEWKLQRVPQARRILQHVQPGATVLVPYELSTTLTALTTRVDTVVARKFYINPLEELPAFHAELRIKLKKFAEGNLHGDELDQVPRALQVLGVDIACINEEYDAGAELLTERGYAALLRTSDFRCYRGGGQTLPGHHRSRGR